MNHRLQASNQAGLHFLQLPGPTNIPARILKSMSSPAVDQRSPAYGEFAKASIDRMRQIFKTQSARVIAFPSSGTGAGEAAIVNTLSPGDGVLVFDSGWFSSLWIRMCRQFGLDVTVIENDWRRPPDADEIEKVLRADAARKIRAVLIVHNETSNGVSCDIGAVRTAMEAADHDALLIVDTISSLASYNFEFDGWGVDVAIAGSQKGLMMPPGMAFHCISERALAATKSAKLPRFYWDWRWHEEAGRALGFMPYTPPIQHFYGLNEALCMLLDEEGLENVFTRHARLAHATRAATEAWGLETICLDPRAYSDTVTAIMLPAGHDAESLRQRLHAQFEVSLGAGLGRLAGRAFRIGHLGAINDTTLMGVLSAIEMGMAAEGIPHNPGGAQIAHESMKNGLVADELKQDHAA